MTGEVFPLIVGFLFISLFLFSIERLTKVQSKQREKSRVSNNLNEKIK